MRIVIEQIADAGVPNKERLILRVTEPANMSFYCVINTIATGDLIAPGPRDAFWIPLAIEAKPGDTIIVYSGPGTQTFTARGDNTLYFFYWGKIKTLWGDPNSRAVLLELLSWQTSGAPKSSLATMLEATRSLPVPPPRDE